jgi:hypothetical protein
MKAKASCSLVETSSEVLPPRPSRHRRRGLKSRYMRMSCPGKRCSWLRLLVSEKRFHLPSEQLGGHMRNASSGGVANGDVVAVESRYPWHEIYLL